MIIRNHVYSFEARMTGCRRLVTAAVALQLVLFAGAAHAQTVLIRNAPPDSDVEVVLNSAPVGTGKVGAAGIVLIDVNLEKNVNKTETDAVIFVDQCEKVRRIVIVERTLAVPAADVGCTRRDMGGVFLVKRISTLAFDFGGPNVTLLLRQGKVSLAPPRSWDGGRTGLLLFAGGGLTSLSNFAGVACGTATECANDNARFGYGGGAEYWVTPNIAATGSYFRPADLKTTGSGDRFKFTSTMQTEVATAGGKVGFPAGRTRIYGHAGGLFTRAIVETDQTVDPLTVTVDGVDVTVPGGNVKYNFEARGWGWFLGGGLEVWITSSVGLYGEFDRSILKGKATKKEEGTIDDAMNSVVGGVKIKLF
jgi:hypothetical protein